jgi:hypothetical protein
MPIYYFDFENGDEKSHDTTGDLLSDHHAARIEASWAIPEYANDVVVNDGPELTMDIRARDEQSRPILNVSIQFEASSL